MSSSSDRKPGQAKFANSNLNALLAPKNADGRTASSVGRVLLLSTKVRKETAHVADQRSSTALDVSDRSRSSGREPGMESMESMPPLAISSPRCN